MKWTVLLVLAAGCVPLFSPRERRTEPGVMPVSVPTQPVEPLERRTFHEGEGVRAADPELTADGTTLYYATNSYGDNTDICRKGVDGRTVERILSTRANERLPRLNPVDPNVIAFCSDEGGEWHIYIANLSEDPTTEGWVRITDPGRHNLWPSWSPDGRRIVYATRARRGGSQWELAVADLGERRSWLLNVPGFNPRWRPRPDADEILFQQFRARDLHLSGLWLVSLVDAEAGTPRLVYEERSRAAVTPAWSADGERVVFAMSGAPLQESPTTFLGDDLYAVRWDGTELQPLTRDAEGDWSPVWGPGRIYFVSRRNDGESIWSLPLP